MIDNLKGVVIEDVPASSWMDRYKNEYQALVTSGTFFEWHPTWTGDWDKDKYAFCHDRGCKKGDTQDPAICEYSGLRPVEGYKEEETIDKETERGDGDYMYRWIRDKSGK